MRQRLILFHEDPSVVTAFRLAGSTWRVTRARSLRELKALAARRAPEIIVTDRESHGVDCGELLPAVAEVWPTIRLFLCISEVTDEPAGLIKSLLPREHGLYVAVANTDDIAVSSDAASAHLRESLFRLRLLPYAEGLGQRCTRGLGLGGTIFEELPHLVVERPWSYRRPRDAAVALGTTPRVLLEASKSLGYERSDRLLFRIRAELAAQLLASGEYSWPEARETFGETDGSNFRRRLKQWFDLDWAELAKGRVLPAPQIRAKLRLPTDRGQRAETYPPQIKTYRVLAESLA